jgi:hypothetical protein
VTRKRLATELRAQGEPAAAKELQAARRPSTSAWALNQLARREPALVEALQDGGRALLAAQTRAASGKPDALRDAMRAHRVALTEAADAALAVLGPRANEAFRGEILSTLRAASAADDVGEQLRLGRLTHEISAPGFPDAIGLTLVADTAGPEPDTATRRRAPKQPRPQAEKEDRERQRERQRARREEEARAVQRRAVVARSEAALRRAAAAEADGARAQATIDRLQTDLDRARTELRAAGDRGRAARDEAAALEE